MFFFHEIFKCTYILLKSFLTIEFVWSFSESFQPSFANFEIVFKTDVRKSSYL